MLRTLRAAEEPHSKYGASSAHRWGECPGSVVMCEGRESTSSPYAIEGTAAHTLASNCLVEQRSADEFIGCTIEVESDGDIHPIVVDSDMAGHVQKYLDLVLELAEGSTLLVEQTVDYSEAVGLPPGVGFGTADALIVGEDRIVVVDLKYGRGKIVDAQNNDQLLLYAAGARALSDAMGYEDPVLEVFISQPRVSDEPSRWGIDPGVMAERLNELCAAISAAVGARAPEVRRDPKKLAEYLHPGEEQCTWCLAKATCPALAQYVRESLSNSPVPEEFFDYASVSTEFEDLDSVALPVVQAEDIAMPSQDTEAEVLSLQLKAAPLIESWLAAVRAEVERRLLAGDEVPGFKLVQGRQGSRKWDDPQTVEDLLRNKYRLKIEEAYDLKLISPTTAEKLAKEGAIGPRQWKALQDHITRVEGQLSVAPESDKRDAVSTTPVEEAFESLV